ncbi:MAG: zf-HC2 domain-containing protein [Clostridia bacterium]|nr:zf-HC2 domain-containing protein [Clostridia bacterium]
MKNKCELIQDLLPLYCDGCASAYSCAEVEEHLDECSECRCFAASYRRASKISAKTAKTSREHTIDIELPYATLAERIRIRRRINTACSIGGVIAGAMLLTYVLDKLSRK